MSQERAEGLSKVILSLTGFTLVFTGLAMFFIPELAAEGFPWLASPFVAMVLGGWSIGLGAMALDAAVGWTRKGLSRVYASVIAVWLFCVLELLVLATALTDLRTDHWLTYPYVLGLLLGAASALLGAPVLWRRRELLATQGTGNPLWLRLIYAVSAVGTAALAVALLVLDTSRVGFVPEPLVAESARAAAAFLVALVGAIVPLVFTRDVEPILQFARAGLYIDVLSVVAAGVWVGTFDVSGRPAGFTYLGAWVVAAAAGLLIVYWNRRAQGRVEVQWSHE